LGEVVKARQLISDQCSDPEILKRTALAFDEAWAVIEVGFAGDQVLAEAARLQLARIILNVSASDSWEPSQIRSAALLLELPIVRGHNPAADVVKVDAWGHPQ
jgi:hypothetical protein